MPRTAQRLFPGHSATTATDTAVELLDRTGIVAASLPRRRRTGETPPAAAPVFTRTPVCDQDLRPKSVVIRRRARLWLGGGAAVLLVALGWVGGGLAGAGMFGTRSDEAASVQARPAAATDAASERKVVPPAQPAPQPQPPAVTVYVPVPAHTTTPKHTQPQAKPAPMTTDDTPRDDLPKTSTPPASTMNPVERLVQPFASLAKSMVARYR